MYTFPCAYCTAPLTVKDCATPTDAICWDCYVEKFYRPPTEYNFWDYLFAAIVGILALVLSLL